MTSLLDPATLFSLEGKVAVVTGAGRGIGKVVAMLFAEAGATVVVADKNSKGANEVSEQLGAHHEALEFDLFREESIIELFAKVEQRFDRCDILVNNGGIYPKYPLEELTEPQWHEMQKINVWGCFVAMREAARLMRKNGTGGRIINVSSIASLRTAVHHQVAYNASKAALDSMTKSAALEFACDGILVNSVCPGAVTPIDPKPRDPGHVAATGPLMEAGRWLTGKPAQPHEIAGPILMLASAAGGNFTGQCLVMDSGFSIS